MAAKIAKLPQPINTTATLSSPSQCRFFRFLSKFLFLIITPRPTVKNSSTKTQVLWTNTGPHKSFSTEYPVWWTNIGSGQGFSTKSLKPWTNRDSEQAHTPSKSPARTQQQIVSRSRRTNLQTGVDEKPLVEECLQSKNTIHAGQLLALVDDVMAHTHVD